MSEASAPFIRKGTPPTPQDPYPSDQEVRECEDGTIEIRTPAATSKLYEEYQQAIEQYPQDAGLRVQYAFHLHYTDLPKAIEQVRVAIGLEPDDADSHSLLASLLRRSGETEASLEEYQQALRLSTQKDGSVQAEVTLLWGLAETMQQSGDIEGAQTQLQEAITRQQHYVDNKVGSQQLLQKLKTKLRELRLPEV